MYAVVFMYVVTAAYVFVDDFFLMYIHAYCEACRAHCSWGAIKKIIIIIIITIIIIISIIIIIIIIINIIIIN